MIKRGLPTNARWLDKHDRRPCYFCDKPSAGILMSDRNERLSPCCERCAKAAAANYGKDK